MAGASVPSSNSRQSWAPGRPNRFPWIYSRRYAAKRLIEKASKIRIWRIEFSDERGARPAESVVGLVEKHEEGVKEAGADECGAGNGEDPSPHDAAGDAPTYGGEAPRGTDADDGTGDGVSGANRDAEMRGAKQRKGASRLRRETAEGRKLGDALAHGLDDAPAAGHGAACHGKMAADNDPVWHVIAFEQSASDEGGGDDAHAFLRVVGTVAEAVASGG